MLGIHRTSTDRTSTDRTKGSDSNSNALSKNKAGRRVVNKVNKIVNSINCLFKKKSTEEVITSSAQSQPLEKHLISVRNGSSATTLADLNSSTSLTHGHNIEKEYRVVNVMPLNELLKEDITNSIVQTKASKFQDVTLPYDGVVLKYNRGGQYYTFSVEGVGDLTLHSNKDDGIIKIKSNAVNPQDILICMCESGLLKRDSLKKLPLCCNSEVWEKNVPHNIHYIWLGKNTPHKGGISNIINTLKLNPDCRCYLWTDNRDGLINQLLSSGYSNDTFDKLKVRALELEPSLAGIVARECTENGFGNKAAASDVVRLAILKKYGGVYMDVDVATKEKIFPISPLKINNNVDCLWLTAYDFQTCGNQLKIKRFCTNTVMAAPPESKLINYMIDNIKSAYNDKPSSEEFTKKLSESIQRKMENESVTWKLKRNTADEKKELTVSVTGPGMLSETYRHFGFKASEVSMDNCEIFGHIDVDYHFAGWKFQVDNDMTSDPDHWGTTKKKLISEV